MKQSLYNYLIPDGEKLYCFNGLSLHFFNIHYKNKDILKSILNSPFTFKDKLPHFYKMLIKGGFIVADQINELEIIRNKNKEACNSKQYNLIILPTLNCNFRCWYCYEKHTPYEMSGQTVESIRKYIQNLLDNEDIESLNLEWFGGEPFLHFNNVIKPISLYAKNSCIKKNIPFMTGATTNGYLINRNTANELADINFNHLQVTLDGEKSLHDQTRVASNDSSFDTILRNMNFLCSVHPQIGIIIRINYDDKNFNPTVIFSQINEIIEEKYHHHFSFLLRKVWQIECVENGNEKLLEFMRLIRGSKFGYHHTGDLNTSFLPCYAAHKNMKLITPYGSIGKCTTKDDFEKHAIGRLDNQGNIIWRNDIPYDEIYSTPFFENPKCLNCKHLPICMGVCPKNIDPNGKIGLTEECRGKTNDLKFTDTILNYCKMNEILTLKSDSL